jgi:hypothetical protein
MKDTPIHICAKTAFVGWSCGRPGRCSNSVLGLTWDEIRTGHFRFHSSSVQSKVALITGFRTRYTSY